MEIIALGVLQVLEAMLAAKLDLTETEFVLLLLACRGSASREQAWRILNSMCRELTTLTQEALQAVKLLFK